MTPTKNPKTISVDTELTDCPECAYTNGFHVTFVRSDGGKLKIILVCPSCSAKFDIDWTTS